MKTKILNIIIATLVIVSSANAQYYGGWATGRSFGGGNGFGGYGFGGVGFGRGGNGGAFGTQGAFEVGGYGGHSTTTFNNYAESVFANYVVQKDNYERRLAAYNEALRASRSGNAFYDSNYFAAYSRPQFDQSAQPTTLYAITQPAAQVVSNQQRLVVTSKRNRVVKSDPIENNADDNTLFGTIKSEKSQARASLKSNYPASSSLRNQKTEDDNKPKISLLDAMKRALIGK